MRRFVNPGNTAFEVAVNSQIYVDKTGLLAYTNSVINTKQALICSSRPRRFGKSITADMLCAYYSRGCDSDSIFASYEIAKSDSYKKYLNQYDVIYLDIQWCMMDAGSAEQTVSADFTRWYSYCIWGNVLYQCTDRCEIYCNN